MNGVPDGTGERDSASQRHAASGNPPGKGPDSGPRPGGTRKPGPGGPADVVSGAEFAGVGLQFALTIAVFAYAGIWLDERMHTRGRWLVIVCVFAGAAAGFSSIYRKLMSKQRGRQ